MAITKLNLPAAEGVDYSSGLVDYYQKTDPVYAGEAGDAPFPYSGPDNRPMRNLTYRDTLIGAKLDELIDQINGTSTDKSGLIPQEGLSNYKPYAQGTPDNTIEVNAGQHISSDGTRSVIKASPTTSGLFTAVTPGQERYDVVSMDDTGSVVITQGAEIPATTGDPTTDAPDIPPASLGLAIVKVDEDTTVVVDDADITDIREFLNKGAGGVARVTGADTAADYLGTKLVSGAGVTLTVLNPGANETLQISSPGTGSDELVKASGADTTAGYLGAKLQAGTNIALNVVNPGANEKIEIVGAVIPPDVRVAATGADTTPNYLGAKMQAGANISLAILNPGADEKVEITASAAGSGYPLLPAEIWDFRPDDTNPTTNVTLWSIEAAIRYNPDQDRTCWFSINKSDQFPATTDIIFQLSYSITTSATSGDACRFIMDYWVVQDGQVPSIGSPDNTLTEDIALTGKIGDELNYLVPLATLKIAQAHIPAAIPARIICRLTRDINGAAQNYPDAFDLVSMVPYFV